MQRCYHCDDQVPHGTDFTSTIRGDRAVFCCTGCQAAAMFIEDAGLANFYAHREQAQAATLRPAENKFEIYNDRDIAAPFVTQQDNQQTAIVYISDLYCPACVWLASEILQSRFDSIDVAANSGTRRLNVTWPRGSAGLGDLLRCLSRVGFEPQPVIAGQTSDPEREDYRSAIKRLVVAGIFGMQAMMLAAGLYAGEFHGMQTSTITLLRVASLVTVLPIMFYAAVPFFKGALRGLRFGKPGMDVPVSLALTLAFTASAINTLTHADAVYFDSIAMFVGLLCVSRFLEMRARHSADDQGEAIAALLPASAVRISAEGQSQTIARDHVQQDDLLAVEPGDIVAADGVVTHGAAGLDERLITGESRSVSRKIGDKVLAGTRVLSGSLTLRVTQTGAQTFLGDITRLVERAQSDRGTLQNIADRLATPFVITVLCIALVTGVVWSLIDPSRIIPVVLSVLIVACPCALALATPTTLAVTATTLAKRGVLLTQARILEVIKRHTVFVFDKTGTLTQGRPSIKAVDRIRAGFSRSDVLAIAAALEQDSPHSIAAAFEPFQDAATLADSPSTIRVGAGVSGIIDGKRYRIGHSAFVTALSATQCPDDGGIFLGDEHGIVARFEIVDALRADAIQTVRSLREQGHTVVISSGDGRAAVAAVAKQLDIESWHARHTPADKLQLVENLRADGQTVVMVGDGANDAPVLAQSDAAIAIGSGTALARASSDAIIVGESLAPLLEVIAFARRSATTVRLSLAWAASYNAMGVSLAALGWISPWMAAIGMTASSLLVVWNALRLGKTEKPESLQSTNELATPPADWPKVTP
ncbi:MAG: heavy metal translocating P-type ATPase [Pseudomonadota bacterium]